MKERVYLSAPGLICCAGRNRDELYDSCLKGHQGGLSPGMPLPVKDEGGGKAAEQFFPSGIIPWELPPPSSSRAAFGEAGRIHRIMDSALEQIRSDLEKAIAKYGRRSIGICLGSCDNGSEVSLKAHRAFFEKGEFPEGYDLRFQSAAFPAEYIARKFGIEGPAMTIATACASGASALVRGAELIQAGVCDAVIAGGVDIVSETVFLGFHSLEVFSAALTNPFSKERKGINLGEGAAFFLLCREDPGRGIELFGAGESADAFHMTTPGPDGEGPARAMKAALLDAGLEAEEIAYVNLHGTGTIHNDRAEALAMKAVFKDHIPPSSSTKPITGHTLGASGALEAAICWMVLETGKGLPLHCWDGMRDETIPFLPLVPTGSGGSSGPPGVCMSNNFAFGGCNVSLILGRRTRDY